MLLVGAYKAPDLGETEAAVIVAQLKCPGKPRVQTMESAYVPLYLTASVMYHIFLRVRWSVLTRTYKQYAIQIGLPVRATLGSSNYGEFGGIFACKDIECRQSSTIGTLSAGLKTLTSFSLSKPWTPSDGCWSTKYTWAQ